MEAFVLPLFAPMQATRLSSYCGRDEKRGFSPRTFHEICENCKSGPCNRGTEFPHERHRNEFAGDAFAGSGVPRSCISSALSHSRPTGAEINCQTTQSAKAQ